MKTLLQGLVILSWVLLLAMASTTTLTQNGDTNKWVLSYQVNLYGLTVGNDVYALYATGMEAGGTTIEYAEEDPSQWPGTGSVAMAHTFPSSMKPTRAVIFGLTKGIAGGTGGTDVDHIVLGADSSFVSSAVGLYWNETFPGLPGQTRMRHSTFVDIVKSYHRDASNRTASDLLDTFVQKELIPIAGFDPSVSFSLVRFSIAATTAGRVVGTVFIDTNNNGQPDSGEGVAGPTVSISTTGSNCAPVASVTADANGFYQSAYFVDSNTGTCTVTVTLDSSNLLTGCTLQVGFSNPKNNVMVVPGGPPPGLDTVVNFGFTCPAPSAMPSSVPSAIPSRKPSAKPSSVPSGLPSQKPSAKPSSVPSGMPSARPSAIPSRQPSGKPSAKPSAVPSRKPSAVPSRKPSAVPSRKPSTEPSRKPSAVPSRKPSARPSRKPSARPSRKPSARPSSKPSARPSSVSQKSCVFVPTWIPFLNFILCVLFGPNGLIAAWTKWLK